MGKVNLLKQLKKNLESNNIQAVSDTLVRIYQDYTDDWIKVIKLSDCIISPLSHRFSNSYLVSLLSAFQGIIGRVPVEASEEFLFSLYQHLLVIYGRSAKVNDRLETSEFMKRNPVEQIYLLCTFLEDQARIAEGMIMEHLKDSQPSTGLHILTQYSRNQDTGSKSSMVDSIEGLVDCIDTNIRYIFYKFGKNLSGELTKNVSPYNDGPFKEILILGNVRDLLDGLWQQIKYRGWKWIDKDGITYYAPPSIERFLLEEASVERFRLYQWELTSSYLHSPVAEIILQREKMLDSIYIDLNNAPWKPNVPIDVLKDLVGFHTLFDISLEELLDKLYKVSISSLRFGPPENNINGDVFLKAVKLMSTISYLYKKASWKLTHGKYDDGLAALVPIMDESDLLELLSQVSDMTLDEAKSSLSLLCFNPKHTRLDLWLQPLIPIGGGRVLLIPSVFSNVNLIRLFEAHILQWDIGFNDRGPLFEDEIRSKLRKVGVVCNTKQVKFIASDGKEVEYDVLSWFKDYMLIIEAKCLRNPYSPYDRFNCWKGIENGVQQLKRRRDILLSDWNSIREHSDIWLPEKPPAQDKILCMVITNIFTFTGVEVDGIRVTDLMCLYRYLSSSDIEARTSTAEGPVQTIPWKRIWAEHEPLPIELWEFIRRPPALELILKNADIDFYPIPPIEKNQKVIFCAHMTMKTGILEDYLPKELIGL